MIKITPGAGHVETVSYSRTGPQWFTEEPENLTVSAGDAFMVIFLIFLRRRDSGLNMQLSTALG